MADRFNIYESTYDSKRIINKAFININHEFRARGYIKAFEAHVIKEGGFYFMVRNLLRWSNFFI